MKALTVIVVGCAAILVATITASRHRSRSRSVAESIVDARGNSPGRQDTVISAPVFLDSAIEAPVLSPPQRSVVPPSEHTASLDSIGDVTSRDLEALKRQLVIPVQGVTRSQLRDTYSEARGSRTHGALDILAPRGTPVISAMDGKLMRLFNSRTGGLMVYAADPTDRFILLYGHLDRYAEGVRDGMPLKRGQVIGYVGTTGNAPPGTPHLHFGILRGQPSRNWSRGVALNPFPLLTLP
jgi:peptidoglycan LD-endopeptidase LytH